MHILAKPPPQSSPPNTKHGCKRNFSEFRAKGTCLAAADVVLFLLNEIQKIEANVVVSECVRHRAVAY